ncbi:MAG: glycosyltransferase family 9 protein [Bacteroidetes bacterium]|nr:glycosyltransferase family 9 protein [Bacteroidota bacterium]
MKILIIRFSSIGDIVLTTPVIRCLKKQLSDVEIHYLTKKAYVDLVAPNPYVSKVYTLDASLKEVLPSLKAEQYDYVVDLHHNLRSFLVKSSLGKKSVAFKKLNIEKWLSVNFKLKALPNTHIVDRYLQTVEKLGVVNDNDGLDFFIQTDEKPLLEKLGAVLNRYVVFAIGAKFATKRLPNEKIYSLLTKVNKPIVLIGGKEDVANAASIASKVDVINLCGLLTLHESAIVLKYANTVLTHDSGMMHIAAALKKKIISIWGNTIPEFGMYPYLPGPASQLIEVKNLSCRPCSKIGFNACPKKHFKCMNAIDENSILKSI